MDNLQKFLSENEHISISDMEKTLDIARGSIRPSGRGIPKKYYKQIETYLETKHGYTPETMTIIENEDNHTSVAITLKQYNVNVIPAFKDHRYRFQDNQKLWRRIEDYGVDTDGNIKDKYKPQTDEILNDKIGEFYVAKSGDKIYINYNK